MTAEVLATMKEGELRTLEAEEMARFAELSRRRMIDGKPETAFLARESDKRLFLIRRQLRLAAKS